MEQFRFLVTFLERNASNGGNRRHKADRDVGIGSSEMRTEITKLNELDPFKMHTENGFGEDRKAAGGGGGGGGGHRELVTGFNVFSTMRERGGGVFYI